MYYNFSDNNTNMNHDALSGFSHFNKEYSIIGAYHLNENSQRIVLGKNSFTCRFCGKTKPEVTFKSKAHAIPHSIGNNTLFTHIECDSCNGKFGRLLESHFSNFMHLEHLLAGISGKKGQLKFKSNDALITTTGSSINWSKIPDKNMTFNKAKGITVIKQKTPTFIPVAVHKCLVKMAITIMPNEHFVGFEKTIEWLNEVDHEASQFKFDNLWIIKGSASTAERFPNLSALIVKRKENVSDELPFMMFRLTYGNFLFQVSIPLNKEDGHKTYLNMPYMPSLLDFQYGYGKVKLQPLNLCETQPKSDINTIITITDIDGSGTYGEEKIKAN